jgi:hypothetical protein
MRRSCYGRRRMRHLALLALLFGCRESLDELPDAPPTECETIAQASDLTTIKRDIFERHCNGRACHKEGSDQSELHLQLNPHADLVNVQSDVDPAYQLVVPGQPRKSYMLYMLQQVAPADMDPPITYTDPPDDVEFMPVDFTICKEKLDAIQRWIEAGAPDN